jgi:hypothetical protein
LKLFFGWDLLPIFAPILKGVPAKAEIKPIEPGTGNAV